MQLEGIDIDINKLPAEARKEFLRYKIKLEEKRKECGVKLRNTKVKDIM